MKNVYVFVLSNLICNLPEWTIGFASRRMKYSNACMNILKENSVQLKKKKRKKKKTVLRTRICPHNYLSRTGKRCRNHHRTVQFYHLDSNNNEMLLTYSTGFFSYLRGLVGLLTTVCFSCSRCCWCWCWCRWCTRILSRRC